MSVTVTLRQLPARPTAGEVSEAMAIVSVATGQTWVATRLGALWAFINETTGERKQSRRSRFTVALAEVTGVKVEVN